MILEITDDQLAGLSDEDLRTLVAYLCEREVIAHGHSASVVTWGGHQNAPDGGIDVRVSLAAEAPVFGFVPRPASGYQVKAQDMPENAIQKEMAPDGVVLPSIVDLAANGGAYIIVSSKGSLSDAALKKRKAAMRKAVVRLPHAESLTVDFYDRRRLATWVNQHLGLVPWVRMKIGQPLSGWHPFEDWSSSPAPLDQPYMLDDRVRLKKAASQSDGLSAADGVAALREILAKPKGIVRLVGLSGVGKTRLIQALFDERIGTNALPHSDALYTDMSESPDPVPLEMLSRLLHLGSRVVVIVDNCGGELHQKLSNRIAASSGAVSLITVEYDINDDEPEKTDVFKLEPASVDLVEKILEQRYPSIAAPSRRVIASFSDGNARVAFALAETARNGESLAALHDGELFRRLFNQQQEPNDDLFDAAKACALLYSFDGETLDGGESELVPLAKLAGQTVDQLYKHVATLYRRQLVQKRSKWRAILPHALAHRLAKRALAEIPFQRIDDTIMKGASGRMLRSFARRMGYLHDDERAVAVASRWLAQDGLLAELGKLNELGENILENIAPANPAATLGYFERSASKNGDVFFTKENQNKKVIVRLTRALAYDPALFAGSANLLKRFALAETEKEHDSALDPLKSLFSLYLSGTHATAEQRVAFISGLFRGPQESEIKLAVKLLDAMLQTSHFTSSYSFEFGAWKRDYGFSPRTGVGIRDWYARALELAREIGLSGSTVAPNVRKNVASHIPQLLRVGMADEVIAAIKAFAGDAGWPEGWIGLRSALKRYKDDMPAPLQDRLKALEKSQQPSDLTSMIRSFALSPEWGALDIADLEEEVEHKPLAARERIYDLCNELGQKLAQDAVQFDALLPEIVASDSNKTFAVGRGFATACQSLSECWERVRAHFVNVSPNQRRAQVLGGFLSASMARDAIETEKFLDGALADPELQAFFVYLQVCAGVRGRAFERLLRALDHVSIFSFRQLSGGRAHEGLTDQQLHEFLVRLVQKEDAFGVAFEILGMRVFGLKSDRKPVSEGVKSIARELIASIRFTNDSSHLDHLLGETIEICLDGPNHEPLARELCVRIFEGVKSHAVYAWNLGETIRAVTKAHPIAVLDILVERAAEDDGIRRTMFQDVRNERACPLDSISPDIWLSWASSKPETRFPQLAEVMRFSSGNDDDQSNGWSDSAKLLIQSSPDPAKVLDVFIDRFCPMSWSGSRADIMQSRVPMIEALQTSDRPAVAAWAKENAPKYSAALAQERSFEASRDRRRDEAFE